MCLVNLLTGVILGSGLALVKLLRTTQNMEAFLTDDPRSGTLTLNLQGIGTFVSLAAIGHDPGDGPCGAESKYASTDCGISIMPVSICCQIGSDNMRPIRQGQVNWDKLRGFRTRRGKSCAMRRGGKKCSSN